MNITKEQRLVEWLDERLGLVYLGLTQLAESPGYWETYYEDEIEPLESLRALIESSGEKGEPRFPPGVHDVDEDGPPAPPPADDAERREGHCALKYDKTTRTIKTFDPNPGPLPKEVEEAMARMPDAILCAYAFRMGHTRATIPSVSEATYDNEADEAALALIQAAIRPKVVTRRWVETLAFSVANEHQDDCDELIREWLRDLGIEVGP